MWEFLRACATCPTPRLNLKFELRPSWNNIHDMFRNGTVQDTPSLYMELLTEGNILYWVLSSGDRLIFCTPASDGVLLAVSIKHITNLYMYIC